MRSPFRRPSLARPVLTLAFSLSLAATPAGAARAAPAQTHPATPADLVAAKRALAAAVSHGTAQDVMKARGRFAALSVGDPSNPRIHYWVAVADWRAVPRLGAAGKDLAARTCDDGLTEIGRALAGQPGDAEALAVRASLLGMSMQFHPGSMMTLGPEIEEATERALHAGPDNPRVLLLAGLNTLNKPSFVGGGAEPALAQLRKSQELFASVAPADSTAPDWGQDDAYLWAGRASMQLGKPADARAAYLRVLELNPDQTWVRRELLPEAEKALAAGAPAGAPAAK